MGDEICEGDILWWDDNFPPYIVLSAEHMSVYSRNGDVLRDWYACDVAGMYEDGTVSATSPSLGIPMRYNITVSSTIKYPAHILGHISDLFGDNWREVLGL